MNIPNDRSPSRDDNQVSVKNYSKWMFWKKQRYVVAVLGFFGFFNVYALRSNLSIAIVAMTENKSIILDNGTVIFRSEFQWDSKIQGYVLSSFFYGYITSQLIGGWLSAKIGGKRLFGAGIAVTAILTLLTPVSARTSVYLLLAVRIIEGVCEGATYPSICVILSKWAPPLERTKLLSIAFSGCYVGTVTSIPVSAYLAATLGWPSVFYFFGGTALIWYSLWWFLVTESPADDSRISQAELEYIRQSLKNIDVQRNIKHPWKQILTSPPVWATVVATFADFWGVVTLQTELPRFMKDTFNYDLSETGFLSSLPYLLASVTIQFSGQVADWFREKKIFTTTQVRKIFTCVFFLWEAIFLVIAVFFPSPIGTIVCLSLAVGLGACSWSGFRVNFLDIAPQHASVLMGISVTFGCLGGIVSPILTGYIVTTPTAGEWQIVFYISAGLYLIGCVVYGIFGSGEIQPWAVEVETKTELPSEEVTRDNESFEHHVDG